MPLLEVYDLKTHFFTRRGIVKAVDGVSFILDRGQTLGLVGESGSGKSITALSILRLVPRPAGRIVGGRVLLNGEDLLTKSESEMRRYRGRLAMVLQDPTAALNPVLTIGDQLGEAFRFHPNSQDRRSLFAKMVEVLRQVRIPEPEQRLRAFPHEMSGGMKQRVVGAIAIACRAELLLADEPTTALDSTLQLQYIKLLKELQQIHRFGMIFITHDLGIVAKLCDHVAVMYAGTIVESATVRELLTKPAHPYTRALIQSVPRVDQRSSRLASIEGDPPDPLQVPAGCAFRPRCSVVGQRCVEVPQPHSLGSNHTVRCWNHA